MNTAGGRSASCRSRALMMDIVTVSASPLSGVLYSSAAAVSSATARTACSGPWASIMSDTSPCSGISGQARDRSISFTVDATPWSFPAI